MSYPKLTFTLLCAALCAVGMGANAVDNSRRIINTPPSHLEWKVTDEGVGFAPLQGDRFNEAYMAMVKLPAGLVSPSHIKSSSMYGLVVSGVLVHVANGLSSEEVELPAGSFYKIPAGLAHVSQCISKVDCITFLYQDGKFDFLPVER